MPSWPNIATLVAALALSAAAPAQAAVTPAWDAAAFRDSIGVQTHITYYDTPYKDWPAIVEKLDDIGIDHLRDGIYANPAWGAWNERYYQAVELAARHGKRFTVGMGQPGSGLGSLSQLVSVAAGRLRPAVEAVEAPNEYDLFSGLSDWAPSLRSYVADLSASVRAEPRLDGVPVVGPSFARSGASPQRLGDVSRYLDQGNMHPYTGGQAPSREQTRRQLDLAGIVSGSRPVIASEAGFHNALAATDGQPPVPEDVAAGYTLRTFLEHFRAGVARTFIYELVDEGSSTTDPEKSFGLLRSDLSEKPAATALRRLLTVLGRPRPVGTDMRWLDLGVSPGVEQMLLQRAPGEYQLILWQPASTWDVSTRTRIPVASRPITLDLPADAMKVARPVQTAEEEPVALAGGRGVVDVGADPVVVSFRVRGTGLAAADGDRTVDPPADAGPRPQPWAENAAPATAAAPSAQAAAARPVAPATRRVRFCGRGTPRAAAGVRRGAQGFRSLGPARAVRVSGCTVTIDIADLAALRRRAGGRRLVVRLTERASGRRAVRVLTSGSNRRG